MTNTRMHGQILEKASCENVATLPAQPSFSYIL